MSVSSIQFSRVQLFVTPWIAAHQASLSITNSWSLPKFMSIASVMTSTHFILWHSLILMPSIFSSIKVFFNESAAIIRWPKYWNFSFSISSSNEYAGLTSFKIYWFGLLAFQRILKNLLQHRISKASNSLVFCHLVKAMVFPVQFSSVPQLCPTLCDPMNRSIPGLPVHHQLPEFTQTHIYRVGDAIQPSHPQSSTSPPAPNPSQHEILFQWVNSSHEVAKVLEFQL